jgi:hypothetical protein
MDQSKYASALKLALLQNGLNSSHNKPLKKDGFPKSSISKMPSTIISTEEDRFQSSSFQTQVKDKYLITQKNLCKFSKRKKIWMKFIFGLGNTQYEFYNKTAKDVDALL